MVKERRPSNGRGERATGPRGGTTTVTQTGMIRKTLWITDEQNERLRLLAFRARRSEAHLVRRGLELVLALADQAPEVSGGAAETFDAGDEGDEEDEEEI